MSESYDDPRDKRLAYLLQQALDGQDPKDDIIDAQAVEEVNQALGTAMFLQHSSVPSLSPKFLEDLGQELVTEAKTRVNRKKRMAILGGASFLALAASLLLIFGGLFPPPKTEQVLPAKFPKPPVLTEAFLPGSSPLQRIDPIYEAGLRGMREARFWGAHHARTQ